MRREIDNYGLGGHSFEIEMEGIEGARARSTGPGLTEGEQVASGEDGVDNSAAYHALELQAELFTPQFGKGELPLADTSIGDATAEADTHKPAE